MSITKHGTRWVYPEAGFCILVLVASTSFAVMESQGLLVVFVDLVRKVLENQRVLNEDQKLLHVKMDGLRDDKLRGRLENIETKVDSVLASLRRLDTKVQNL